STTPTRGTALIYFRGAVFPGSYKNKPGLCMLGTHSKKGRGFTVEQAFGLLHERGGSTSQFIVLDAPAQPSKKVKMPPGCALAFAGVSQLGRSDDLLAALKPARSTLASDVKLKASRPISPPDKFAFGKKRGDEWVDGRGMVFVWMTPGSYTAGSPPDTPGRYADETQKTVTIKDGFWINRYEMTVAQGLRNRSRPPRGSTARHKLDPLTMVHYDDIRATCRKLTEEAHKHAGLDRSWQYSLTSEQQWEYAARAGSQTRFHFGDDLTELPKYANFADKAFYDSKDIFSTAAHKTLSDGAVRLAKVGSYLPNAWGLHDMHGNVAEWCMGTATRGGSWATPAEQCRNAYRHRYSSRKEQDFIGYRLVIQKTPPPKPKKSKKNK
ncbi:MAG: formylglycine-generating enzyme family protein, partial [Phycisphaeraceae bacterium]|nr:formylglycine-generating enzyme family protein [Phycisphaeraceae bacterium]